MTGKLPLEPGMQIMFWQPAGIFWVPGKGRFVEHIPARTYEEQIGAVVPITFETGVAGTGRIISMEVAADGSGVSVTYEVLP